MRTTLLCSLLSIGSLAGTLFGTCQQATDWQQVGTDKTTGVSGAAIVSANSSGTTALIVRDNKKDGQNRAALVRLSGGKATVTPLDWKGTLPEDLEALSAVPGDDDHYVALSSDGSAYLVKLDGDRVEVKDTFDLPDTTSDGEYEGFSLATVSGRTVAVWAERGADATPATISAATFDLDKLDFGKVSEMDFTAPYPTKDVRHASDVRVQPDGTLIVSSASDSGDDGPFNSGLYAAGTVSAKGKLTARTPRELGRYTGHKVEAVTCLPGSATGLLGTDDENLGGYVRTDEFCRP